MLVLPVENAGQYGKDRIDFHAAQEHIAGIDEFDEVRLHIEIAHRADGADGRTHIAQRGHGTREGVSVGVSGQHTYDGRQAQQQEVHGDVQHLRVDVFVVQDAPSHADFEEGRRVQRLHNLHMDGLEEHHHAVHFQTAGGGTRAAADQARQHQHKAGKDRPGGVVADGEARGGSVAHHVESAVQEGLAPAFVHALELKGRGSDDGHRDQRQGIEAQDGIVQGPQAPVHQRHKDDAEVNGGQEHKHDGEDADERRVEGADAEVARREAAGSADAEGVADGVEDRHSRQEVADEGQGADAQVYVGEDIDGLVGAGAVIVAGEGAQFHIGEPQAHRGGVGDDEQQEHHNAQAADEVGGSPPEEQALGQGFYVFQDGGTGGGEAGNAFKPGVYQIEGTAPHRIGQHTEDEGQEP